MAQLGSAGSIPERRGSQVSKMDGWMAGWMDGWVGQVVPGGVERDRTGWRPVGCCSRCVIL